MRVNNNELTSFWRISIYGNLMGSTGCAVAFAAGPLGSTAPRPCLELGEQGIHRKTELSNQCSTGRTLCQSNLPDPPHSEFQNGIVEYEGAYFLDLGKMGLLQVRYLSIRWVMSLKGTKKKLFREMLHDWFEGKSPVLEEFSIPRIPGFLWLCSSSCL